MRVTNIDTSTIEGKIEVMQRAAKGEKVSHAMRCKIMRYNETSNPRWDWYRGDYQIILPEPREFWLVKDEVGSRGVLNHPPYTPWYEVIHVCEVLPEESGSK